ncbi:MAG: hypothetical protein J2P30_18090, partial [Actinobacteria bacterium]|nr:hypothetical protein [Actinomycetota bacterium]
MKLQYRWLLAAGASVALVGTLGTQALAQPARARAPFRTPARFSGQTTGGVPGSSTVRPPGSARSRLPGGPVPAGFQPQSVTFISGPDGWVLGA